MAKMLKQIFDDLTKQLIEDVLNSPIWLRWGVLVVTCVATIPLALIFRARTSFSEVPRIHIIQNMDNQPKYVSQEANALFLDGRVMRPRVEGTIARGEMTSDTHLFMGVVDDGWATTYPNSLRVDRAFVERGQNRFTIYCTPCHGQGGFGDGLVHLRAAQLVETGANGTTWVAPKNLHEDAIREQPVGQLFNTITKGVRTMSSYASQIPVKDRWAIVAYVKALQFSQDADPASIPNAHALPRVDSTIGEDAE